MTPFELIASQILLGILPSPTIWGLLLIIGFGFWIGLNRLSASTSVFFAFIIVSKTSDLIGGVMNIAHILMLAGLGLVLVMGLLKIGSR